MLFKSTEIVNSVFEWIVFSFFLSELIVNRILIVFLNKIVYYDLSLFHTRFKLCAGSRNELLNELFNSNNDNDKENLTRMLYIENLRSKRLIHEKELIKIA